MLSTILISAFIIGFTGSFHCVGMCGPIALSVPTNNHKKWVGISIYLLGKTLIYTTLGLVFGLLGRQLNVNGLQQFLSIASGACLLLVVAFMLFKPARYHQNVVSLWIGNKLLPLFGEVLSKRSPVTPLYLGMLNGLLPCGMVYLGVIGSLATGSVWQGGLFMLAFGVGTMPVMFSFLLMAKQFNMNYRQKVQKLAPVFITLIGVLLILRGLNLGIPYVSPALHALPAGSGSGVVECH